MRPYDCCFRYYTGYFTNESRTVGILTQAFDEGILTKEDVERCIERLKESGIRISEKLYQRLNMEIGK